MRDASSAAHMDTCVDRVLTVAGTLHVFGRVLAELEYRDMTDLGAQLQDSLSKGTYACATWCSA